MKRAVGYFRVSTKKEEQKESLENQKELFLNFIQAKDYTLYDFYIDKKTGTNAKRKNFLQMLEDAEKGLFDIIIDKELSRLARNVELANRVKRIMENKDIRILSIDGQIDTFDEDKNRNFSLYAWVYENEARTTSSRIKSILKTKQEKGLFLGSLPPYGYIIKDKKLEPRNDYTTDIVKLIFNKYLEGWGQKKLAHYLSEQGHPSPSQVSGKSDAGMYWHSSTIKNILLNPHYLGHLVQNRETTKSAINTTRKQVPKDEQVWVYNTHTPLIDKTIFNLVNQKINKNKNKGKGKGTRNKANLHLFTGLGFCADCGKTLRYRKNSKGYVCSSYHNHGKVACSSHFIREDHLITIIQNDLKQWASIDIDKLDIDKQIEKETTKDKKAIDKLENQINNIKKKNKNYLDLMIDEKITESVYQDYIHFNNIEMKRIQTEINKLASKQNKEKPDMIAIRSELVKIANLEVFDRELLNMLIDHIEIKENGELKVFYTFSAPVQEYNYKRLKSS